jgi:hypothetical protein
MNPRQVVFSLCFTLAGGSLQAQTNPSIDALRRNDIDPISKTYLTRTEIRHAAAKSARAAAALPSRVNHAYSRFMRPVFSQDGGSCGSSSIIGYMFGYEINNYRRLDGHLPENIYPSHFTHLSICQYSDKQDLARDVGIPNSIDYGGDTYSRIYGNYDLGSTEYGWMTGYGHWRNAMFNRIYKNAFLKVDSPETLDLLKGWIYDHNGDTTFAEGGVVTAACAITGTSYVKVAPGRYEANKQMVDAWGPQIDHSITYVGYDDSVGYDVNGDGRITNEVDINGDGETDMADWERGALIMLNSWGTDYCDNGTVYVPYRLCATDQPSVQMYYIRKNYLPECALKVTMDYSERVNLKLSVGISLDTTSTEPDEQRACHHFTWAGGGAVPMLGRWADGVMHTEPMEFGIDVTDLGANVVPPYKLFLIVGTADQANGQGGVHDLSAVMYQFRDADNPADYDSSEYVSPEHDVAISGSAAEFTLGVVVPALGTDARAAAVPSKDGASLSVKALPAGNCQIAYSVPLRQRISVVLFDLHGRLITRLFEGYRQPGLYKISAIDRSLPPGCYICQLTMTQSGRMSKAFIAIR